VTDRTADIRPLIAQARADVEVAQKLVREGDADPALEVLRFAGNELDDALKLCDREC
jgi:hypothetical protein